MVARFLALVLLCVALPAAAAPRFPAYVTLPPMPLANDGVEHEGYGQAEFVLKEKAEVYRGKLWKGNVLYAQKWGDDPRVALVNFVKELEAGGWQVVTRDDPANPPSATLRYAKEGKDAWARIEVFEQASLVVVERGPPTVKMQLEAPRAGATRVGENADFPFLKRFPGSKLVSTAVEDVPMVTQVGDKEPVMVAQGRTVKHYQAAPGTGRLEVVVAYREALKLAGWQIVDEQSGVTQSDPNLTAHYAKADVDIWLWIHAPGDIAFHVGDAGGERTSGRLKAELDRNCKVAVYGVHFDFDKATLRPDSQGALESILKLLNDHPDLALELGGHTDNVGRREYNLKLSEARVNAVRGWLVGKAVKAERLTARGYADTQPVAGNDTVEGRARNRRVELRKPGCK